MSKQSPPALSFDLLVNAIRQVDAEMVAQAGRAVNLSLTLRNWMIGFHVEEYERGGADRAEYGDKLMDTLAARLTQLGISRCDRREIYRYRQFYLVYPQIVETVTPQLQSLLGRRHSGVADEHIGQLNTYVSWYRKNMMAEGDNPPIGILLCTQKDHALMEYALAGIDNEIFVSKYLLELPKKEEMQRFIEAQLAAAEPEGTEGGRQ